jgi:transposase
VHHNENVFWGENMTLNEQIIILTSENQKLREENQALKKENQMLRDIINKLETRLTELEAQLRQAKLNKDSRNSSKPPSTDIFTPKRNQSLRISSGKKSGGQPGHKGTTLQMSETPDEIIDLSPDYCNKCGCSLEHESPHFESKRQEFDIPLIRVTVKEYRLNSKKCPRCGHNQATEFPQRITNNVQYGVNVESLITYLSVYQYLPYRRLKECLKHSFKIDVSEGTINNIIKRMAFKAQPIYNKIKETISQSNQVGSDETSVKVDGVKHWIWVWQTELSTYITASKSRGMKAIENVFPFGLQKSILNTDRWAAQLKTKSAGHQLCISHLLRDLNYIEEVDKIDWSKRLKELLQKGIDLKKQQLEYSKDNPLVVELEQELEILLKEEIPQKAYKKSYTLQKSLLKHRDSILTFLYNKETPADNNASERAIRNAKVKQKVSGQFKTGQQDFCVLRSVIDTCKKRSIDIFNSLSSIANFVPAE